MSKRGRRHSKRRKSSSSSKQSVSPYILKKTDNEKNSISYKDEIVEKGETDCLRKEHVLSPFEDEEKYDNGPPKEKRMKQHSPDNSIPTKKTIYTKTTGDAEKGVRIITSVSVSDIKDSSHKVLFQQSHEPLCENSSTKTQNIVKINCIGPTMELEIHENFQKNSSGIKTTLVLRSGNEGCTEMVYQSEYEKEGVSNNESAQVTENLPNPRIQINNEPQQIRWSFQRRFSNDYFWEVSPRQEFADTEHNSLEQLTNELTSCRIGSCALAQEEHCQPDWSFQKESMLPYSVQAEEAKGHVPSYYQLLKSERCEPEFMRPSFSTNRSSFTKDFINFQKRKSWIRNNSIATIEHKASLFPKKRRQTFPGPSQGAGLMEEDPLLPHAGSFSSFLKSLPLFQAQLFGGTEWDEKFGTDFPSTPNLEIPDSVKLLLSPHIETSTVENPHIVSPVHNHSLRQSNKQQNGEPKQDIEWVDVNSHFKNTPLEVAEQGFDQKMGKEEYLFTDYFTEELSPKTIALFPSCSNSMEQIYQNNTLESAKQCDLVSFSPSQSEAVTISGGAREQLVNCKPTYSLDKRMDTLCTDTVEVAHNSSLEVSDVHSLNPEDVTETVKLKSEEEKTVIPFLSLMMDETNSVQFDTRACAGESNQPVIAAVNLTAYPATCAKEPYGKSEKLDKAVVFKSPLKSQDCLTPIVHKEPNASSSDHWAKRRKLFRESKELSSAGVSSFTSDITEESASEDVCPSSMTVQNHEDSGFYTETFHSSAWMFRGDNVMSEGVGSSLATKASTVSIRDRTVKINKGTGEYPWGLRIQFSKPIVVTEVDTNGAAEEAGLIVGDYVLAVNGIDVTSIPHSEAADLARQGPDILTLTIGSDIARGPNTPRPACRGYLYKRTQSGLIKGWRKRWFVLRHNRCLYYYRHKRDEGKRQAVSVVKLEGAEVGTDSSLGKPFVFKCRPQSGNRVYFFCATSNQERKRWLEAMGKAIHPIIQNHVWVDVTRHNASLPPLAVQNPDCLGLLHKMDKARDMWVQHYCILKDGCLYLYSGIRATHAHGGIYLQGYMVREQPYGSKKSTIELKPPSDEFKTFHLCAENSDENKRWIIVIKASIDKWLHLHQALQDYMNRPMEETKM